jgi:hypothetical protein
MLPTSLGWKNKPNKNPAVTERKEVLLTSTLQMKATSFSEMPVHFKGLHGVISQKITFSITTAVKSSNQNYY